MKDNLNTYLLNDDTFFTAHVQKLSFNINEVGVQLIAREFETAGVIPKILNFTDILCKNTSELTLDYIFRLVKLKPHRK